MITNCTQNNYYNQPAFKGGVYLHCKNVGGRSFIIDHFTMQAKRQNLDFLTINEDIHLKKNVNHCGVWFVLPQNTEEKFMEIFQFIAGKKKEECQIEKYVEGLDYFPFLSGKLKSSTDVENYMKTKKLTSQDAGAINNFGGKVKNRDVVKTREQILNSLKTESENYVKLVLRNFAKNNVSHVDGEIIVLTTGKVQVVKDGVSAQFVVPSSLHEFGYYANHAEQRLYKLDKEGNIVHTYNYDKNKGDFNRDTSEALGSYLAYRENMLSEASLKKRK